MQVKWMLLFVLALASCKKNETPQTASSSKLKPLNTGNIHAIEQACVGENNIRYHSCFTVTCDQVRDRILYVSSEGIVTLTPFTCNK